MAMEASQQWGSRRWLARERTKMGATGQGLWGCEGENEIWVGTIERIGSHVSL